jgi:hypothetical protein
VFLTPVTDSIKMSPMISITEIDVSSILVTFPYLGHIKQTFELTVLNDELKSSPYLPQFYIPLPIIFPLY